MDFKLTFSIQIHGSNPNGHDKINCIASGFDQEFKIDQKRSKIVEFGKFNKKDELY